MIRPISPAVSLLKKPDDIDPIVTQINLRLMTPWTNEERVHGRYITLPHLQNAATREAVIRDFECSGWTCKTQFERDEIAVRFIPRQALS